MATTSKQGPGKYSDGHPLDEVHYLESKIILKGDRFTSLDSFTDFARLVRGAAEDVDIDFSRKGFKGALPQIREVLFLDTADFRLYNKDRKSTRLNSSHLGISYAVFCLKKKNTEDTTLTSVYV